MYTSEGGKSEIGEKRAEMILISLMNKIISFLIHQHEHQQLTEACLYRTDIRFNISNSIANEVRVEMLFVIDFKDINGHLKVLMYGVTWVTF